MGTGSKVAGFVLGLAALFGVAYLAGGVFGTEAIGRAGAGVAEPSHSQNSHAQGEHSQGSHSHGDGEHSHAGGGHPVAGLAVADQGYSVHRLSPDPAAGTPSELAFRIAGPDGRVVTSYVNTHEKPLHLIIARRDLAGFQHLHPVLDAQGVWRVPVVLPAPGVYRVFADFAPDGRTDNLVLGTDLTVAGDYRPAQLARPATESVVDGYTVRMAGTAQGSIRFDITLAGVPVTDLQPYLGAYGHLVALRKGDLGYLHAHPDGGPGVSPPGPGISFEASLPPAGTYRLYLEFAHRGKVHRAEFTVETGEVP